MSESTTDTLNDWAKVRMAHEAVMLDDANGLLKQQRELTALHHAKLTGVEKPSTEGGMVHIGDINHAPPPTKPGMSTLAKLGIAAALFASGAGAGAAIPLAISALSNHAASVDTDTDTIYDLIIPPKRQ